MQTFLTYPDFAISVKHLDNKRLQKQLLETWQIYDTIINNKKAWSNHPAVNMWRGYETGLLYYGFIHYIEWRIRLVNGKRGGKLDHKNGEKITENFNKNKKLDLPFWIGDERVYMSHRANLIRKNPEYYSKFWPNVEPMSNYFWPV